MKRREGKRLDIVCFVVGCADVSDGVGVVLRSKEDIPDLDFWLWNGL